MDAYEYFKAGLDAGKAFKHERVTFDQVAKSAKTLPPERCNERGDCIDPKGDFWKGFYGALADPKPTN